MTGPRAARLSPPIRRRLVVAAVLIYLAVGLVSSRVIVSRGDEEAYLALGSRALRGEISLYQDDMTGHRMPLPFYVLGASQLLFGPDLWIGRLLSLAIGVGVLLAAVAVATRLRDDVAGVLAGLFVATQGCLVTYYATASSHSLTALIVMAATWLLLADELPWRAALGMAVASLLFLTRTTMFPALPVFLLWALTRARGRAERAAVVAAAAAPPTIFFLWDASHLKLLAWVPVLHRFVEPLGYQPIITVEYLGHVATPLGPAIVDRLWSFVLFARRYESWALALAGLALAAVLGRSRAPVALGRAGVWVAGLLGWVLLWHYVIFRFRFELVFGYFPDFAPLAAVLLGAGCAALLARPGLPRLARGALAAGLALGLTVSVIFVRNPLVPSPVPTPFRGDTVQLLERSAGRLRSLVRPGAPVFLFGPAAPVYLAGLRPFLPQLMGLDTFVTADFDARLIARNGLWGRAEVERWLGHEAAYALISPDDLRRYEENRPESVRRIRELLRERFLFLGRVEDEPRSVYDVYRRRA